MKNKIFFFFYYKMNAVRSLCTRRLQTRTTYSIRPKTCLFFRSLSSQQGREIKMSEQEYIYKLQKLDNKESKIQSICIITSSFFGFIVVPLVGSFIEFPNFTTCMIYGIPPVLFVNYLVIFPQIDEINKERERLEKFYKNQCIH